MIRPVKLGREALGRQVVAQGLKPGDRVVVAGAFLIKSELILQNERRVNRGRGTRMMRKDILQCRPLIPSAPRGSIRTTFHPSPR